MNDGADPDREWGPNLAAMMFARAARWPERVLFRYHRDGGWREMRWAGFAAAAAAVARALAAMGIGDGDRVLLCAENRPEIAILELGLMAIGALPVPAYTTNSVADHAHLLRDCGAVLAVASTPALAARLEQAGAPRPVLVMDGPGPGQSPFAALLADAGPDSRPDWADVAARTARIGPEHLACLIYTSGTGGAPKGVMLPHRAMLANCRGADAALRRLRLGGDDTCLSFLPLSHAFEHTIGLFFLAGSGVAIAYARGLEHLLADMQAVRPTVMLVVPRFLALLRGRIEAQAARQPRWRRALFAHTAKGGWSPFAPLVRRGICRAFGGRLRAMMSGGARLDPALGLFFRRMGFEIMQGYGQTEAGPVIGATPPGRADLATVGPPFPGVEARIAGDGEILVRGALVMEGYWNDPDATARALRDGWLHTGDVGSLDQSGNLSITDRKKDFIVLSGGDKVSPARVEERLMARPEIAQAVVAGEGRAAIVALVAAEPGCDAAAVAAAVAVVNRDLAAHERIRRAIPVPAFTIDNGLLTPTGKIRRHLALAAHRAAWDS